MLQSGSGKQISSELTFGADHTACALVVSTFLPLPGKEDWFLKSRSKALNYKSNVCSPKSGVNYRPKERVHSSWSLGEPVSLLCLLREHE